MSEKGSAVSFEQVKQAMLALRSHDRRLLFRWIISEQWRDFQPQPPQEITRVNVREYATRVLQWMAEWVPNAGAPNFFEDRTAYDYATSLLKGLDRGIQRNMLHCIVEAFIDSNPMDTAKRVYGAHEMQRLAISLMHMQTQHEANKTGWLYTGEYTHSTRGRREKRT